MVGQKIRQDDVGLDPSARLLLLRRIMRFLFTLDNYRSRRGVSNV